MKQAPDPDKLYVERIFRQLRLYEGDCTKLITCTGNDGEVTLKDLGFGYNPRINTPAPSSVKIQDGRLTRDGKSISVHEVVSAVLDEGDKKIHDLWIGQDAKFGKITRVLNPNLEDYHLIPRRDDTFRTLVTEILALPRPKIYWHLPPSEEEVKDRLDYAIDRLCSIAASDDLFYQNVRQEGGYGWKDCDFGQLAAHTHLMHYDLEMHKMGNYLAIKLAPHQYFDEESRVDEAFHVQLEQIMSKFPKIKYVGAQFAVEMPFVKDYGTVTGTVYGPYPEKKEGEEIPFAWFGLKLPEDSESIVRLRVSNEHIADPNVPNEYNGDLSSYHIRNTFSTLRNFCVEIDGLGFVVRTGEKVNKSSGQRRSYDWDGDVFISGRPNFSNPVYYGESLFILAPSSYQPEMTFELTFVEFVGNCNISNPDDLDNRIQSALEHFQDLLGCNAMFSPTNQTPA